MMQQLKTMWKDRYGFRYPFLFLFLPSVVLFSMEVS